MLVFKFLRDSLSTFAAVLALGAFYSAQSGRWPVGAPYLAALAAAVLIVGTFVHARNVRQARYSKAMNHIAKAYDICLDSVRRGISNEGKVRAAAAGVCEELSKAFTIITGSPCHVCVKRLRESSEDSPAASTFCRSGRPSKRVLEGNEPEHVITRNTDFLRIFNDVDRGRLVRIFRANALPFVRAYQNTSEERYGTPVNIPVPVLRQLGRFISWKLPYKSAMVAPILVSNLVEEHRRKCLVGYLCVDSRQMYVFRRREEIVLEGLAAALHPMVYNVVPESARVSQPGGAGL